MVVNPVNNMNYSRQFPGNHRGDGDRIDNDNLPINQVWEGGDGAVLEGLEVRRQPGFYHLPGNF